MHICILNTPPQTAYDHLTLNDPCQAYRACKMFCLHARKGFHEHVHGLLIGWAINELDGASLDDIADKVILDIDMFGACMVLSAVCKCNC